jgi:hypothetical protein
MKKLMAAGAVGAALFAGVAAPGVAGAATTHETAASNATILLGGRCADSGTVRVNTSAVYIYAGTSTTTTTISVAYRGRYLICLPIMVGSPYRLCGTTTPANGWIPVDILGDSHADGYVPSTCVTD